MADLIATEVRRWQGGARRQIAFTEARIGEHRYVLAVTSLGGGNRSVELTRLVPGPSYRERKVPSTGKFAKRYEALRAALEAAPAETAP